MKNLILGKHWEEFINTKIEEGRYDSATEVIQESLRLLEEREIRINTLREALIEGEKSGSAGEFDMERIKQKVRKETGL